jgi:hypothetical protein
MPAANSKRTTEDAEGVCGPRVRVFRALQSTRVAENRGGGGAARHRCRVLVDAASGAAAELTRAHQSALSSAPGVGRGARAGLATMPRSALVEIAESAETRQSASATMQSGPAGLHRIMVLESIRAVS